VYWSVGVHQPGVSVGVSNAPPRVIYSPASVVVYPAPVYRTSWTPPGHRKHWHKDRRHDRREDRRDDRWHDRWDDHDHDHGHDHRR
jgi:hypothetical protein